MTKVRWVALALAVVGAALGLLALAGGQVFGLSSINQTNLGLICVGVATAILAVIG